MKFFELQILGEMFVGKNLNKYLWIVVVVCLGFLFLTRSNGLVDSLANPELLTYSVTKAGESTSLYSVTVQFRGDATYISQGQDEAEHFQLSDHYTEGLRETLSLVNVKILPVIDPSKDTVTLAVRYWDAPITWNVGQLPDGLDSVAENLEGILASQYSQ